MLKIDVYSDVVCPWCLVGKRHLEQALALLGEKAPEVDLQWRAFELNPDLPTEGVERRAYLTEKFGPRSMAEVYARVSAAGEAAGIAFEFERILRQPNTRRAHQLVSAARAAGCQDAVVESLFRGYFQEGADLTREQTLVDLAVRAGLEGGQARAALADEALERAVAAEEHRARQMGVSGVPFFVLDGRYGLSGAQPAEALAQAIAEVAAQAAAQAAPALS